MMGLTFHSSSASPVRVVTALFCPVCVWVVGWGAFSTTTAVGQTDVDPDAIVAADAQDGTAAVLSVRGMLTDVTVESLRRRIEVAKERGAAPIILDMDTPGGLVTSSIAIADLIRELTDVHTVAWVNPNAHSGGSIVAVSCDEIIMARSSRIGDSQVIMGGPGGAAAVPEELQAKAYTPVLADFRQSAKLNGYSQVLCESFVLPDREVWWVEHVDTGERRFVFRDEKQRLVGRTDGDSLGRSSVKDSEKAGTEDGDEVSTDGESTSRPDPPSGEREWRLVESYHDPILDMEIDTLQPIVRDDQLLEMSAGEAMAYGFAKAIVSGEEQLEARYAVGTLFRLDPTWSEGLAYWLTSMYVRGFLLLIILLGAYVEFHTPGVGVPGLAALICLAIFVVAPYLTGLANVWEVMLIALGVALIALEVFVIPGFGIAGISGIILFLVGLLATFMPDEPGRSFPLFIPSLPGTMEFLRRGLITMVIAFTSSAVGMVVLGRYLPKTALFARIAPPNPTPFDVLVEDPYHGVARVGDVGVSQGPLRPAGKARFGGTLVDVVTQGDFLEVGTQVEVIERHGNRVVVRELKA